MSDPVEASISESEDCTMVIKGSEISFTSSDNRKTCQLVISGSFSKQELQLHSKVGELNGSGEREGAQWQTSESKKKIFCGTEMDMEISDSQGMSSTDPQENINESFHNVEDGSHNDMVEQLVGLSTGNSVELDVVVAIKSLGLALQKWQNGILFYKFLDSNDVDGGGHDSQLEEADSMLIEVDKSVEKNPKDEKTHQGYNNVDPEDVLAGQSGKEANKIKAPCTKLGNLEMKATTNPISGLEGKESARLGADDNVLAKELLLSIEFELHEEISILDVTRKDGVALKKSCYIHISSSLADRKEHDQTIRCVGLVEDAYLELLLVLDNNRTLSLFRSTMKSASTLTFAKHCYTSWLIECH